MTKNLFVQNFERTFCLHHFPFSQKGMTKLTALCHLEFRHVKVPHYVAKFSQAWRHRRPWDRPNDNCYISSGRRFAKSTFRVSLLSTFRVSRINYSLVCSLPIHTWSSANVDGPSAHCQLNPCKMLHKCSTGCIWKGLQPLKDLESHSMSSPLLPFDRQYTISL